MTKESNIRSNISLLIIMKYRLFILIDLTTYSMVLRIETNFVLLLTYLLNFSWFSLHKTVYGTIDLFLWCQLFFPCKKSLLIFIGFFVYHASLVLFSRHALNITVRWWLNIPHLVANVHSFGTNALQSSRIANSSRRCICRTTRRELLNKTSE